MRRFPKCPLIPVFVDSEVVGENHSDDGALTVTERRCVIDIDAPRLLKRVLVLRALRSQRCADSQINPVNLFLPWADRRGGLPVLHPKEHAKSQGQDAPDRSPQRDLF